MKKTIYITAYKPAFTFPNVYEKLEDALRYFKPDTHVILKVKVDVPDIEIKEAEAEEVDVETEMKTPDPSDITKPPSVNLRNEIKKGGRRKKRCYDQNCAGPQGHEAHPDELFKYGEFETVGIT